MSSRLFEKIRDEMGAGYYVGAENESLTDHGYFAAFVGADNKRVPEILKAVLLEFERIRGIKVGEEELAKVKNYLIGNLFSGLETSESLASFYGGTLVLGQPLKTPEEVAKKLRAVTAEHIQHVARDLFKEKNLNCALIGPFKNKKKLEKIFRLS